MHLPNIKDADVLGKRVFLRADLDVPLSLEGTIEDDTRLIETLPTIQFLLDKGATVIAASHLGRPSAAEALWGKPKEIDPAFSLKPVADWLAHQNDLNHLSSVILEGFAGWKVMDNLFLLENLRFDQGEEKNDPSFAKKLASLADIYVNDAFGVSHRSHASIVGVPAFLPHYAGFLLIKEVDALATILENPKRPLVVIMGGAKLETKMPLVEKMHVFADYLLIGGKLPLEGDILARMQDEKLLIADLTSDQSDITKESVTKFSYVIEKAATVIWNGPMGLIKDDNLDSEKGTRQLADIIAKSPAYKVVGGGDTIDFLKKINLLNSFDFVSTGGGAMLSFLSGEKLPGIEVLIA